MVVIGIALTAAGLIGFISNPIVSSDPGAVFRVNMAHDLVHIVTGLLALGIALGTRGLALANATIGFGVIYTVVFVLCLIDPTLFGLFGDAPVNSGDHVLHAATALVSLGLGFVLRQETLEAGAPR
ncbi:MAG: DUF4383 domain-containing protein [Chloroflexota bacterium]